MDKVVAVQEGKVCNTILKMYNEEAIVELSIIPRVGKSLATDLWNIGIRSISEFRGKDAQTLYDLSNAFVGAIQDRCVLYVFDVRFILQKLPKKNKKQSN